MSPWTSLPFTPRLLAPAEAAGHPPAAHSDAIATSSSRARGSLRPLLAALATLALLAALAAPRPAQAAAVGTVPDLTWGTSRAEVDRTILLMKSAGIRWVRLNVGWNAGEEKGRLQLNQGYFQMVDYAVRKARAAGLNVLMPISDGVPYWASADPNKYEDATGEHWNVYYRPQKMGEYARFAALVARRYKRQGVHHYEVWNEPNHPRFWPSGTSPRQYFQMLEAAYPRIKRADPQAKVVLGGLSANDWSYLQKLYRAGAKRYFDIAAVHPYTGAVSPTLCWKEAGTNKLAKHAFCGIKQVRRTMIANGDRAPIWLTEFGWSTYSGRWGVSASQQADYLIKALRMLDTRAYGYVKAAFIYNFRNNYWQKDADHTEARFGLINSSFRPKPAYFAVERYGKSR